MNKSELVDAIADEAGLSRADAARSLDAFVNTVSNTLKAGDEVAITGFGKFSVAQRGARTGRNPQTGETMTIQASKSPKFAAGAALKEAVAGKR
jgi:DNA-binding protein HU-beta